MPYCSATALIVYVLGLRFITTGFQMLDIRCRVRCFGSGTCRHRVSKLTSWHPTSDTYSYSNPIATRGFSEFIFEYCRSSSFVSSEITFGSVTCTSTN